ncbi:MAG TPA: ATP-dependent Clp protease adaptor ClpS [Dehalococcoidia bacterium]|jgi:ATP-dependent Clp protease adaptor protein ClpS|nr:ATP-dependent Clp protease adaptor ClpS [Dehalococcoidia bacterium]
MPGTSTTTTTTPEVQERTDVRATILPPWRVMLHNDDVNTFEHVIASLLKTVPSLSPEDATAITMEAHFNGVALVIVTPKERAEFYRERLEACGLTSTIEPDE